MDYTNFEALTLAGREAVHKVEAAARERLLETGRCPHPFIRMTAPDSDRGVCEICGRFFAYRGLGLWEPAGRPEVVA